MKTFHSWSCCRVLRMKWNVDGTVRLFWSKLNNQTKDNISKLQLGGTKGRSVFWAWIKLVQVMDQWFIEGSRGKILVQKLRHLDHNRIRLSILMLWTAMIVIALTTQHWSAHTVTTWAFLVRFLTVCCMWCMPWYLILPILVYNRMNGKCTWRRSQVDVTFKSISALLPF